MKPPANDNTASRARPLPILGTLDIDTGRLRPVAHFSTGRSHGAVFGRLRAVIVTFPRDRHSA